MGSQTVHVEFHSGGRVCTVTHCDDMQPPTVYCVGIISQSGDCRSGASAVAYLEPESVSGLHIQCILVTAVVYALSDQTGISGLVDRSFHPGCQRKYGIGCAEAGVATYAI